MIKLRITYPCLISLKIKVLLVIVVTYKGLTLINQKTEGFIALNPTIT